MQFKLDKKDQYTVITPQANTLDAQLAANLAVQCQQLSEKGDNNFIIDLELCNEVLPDFLLPFIELSARCYEQGQSFVLVNPPVAMIQMIKAENAIDSINHAPTLVEAIDIVSMEILERDLFDEQ
ncbi:MAG: hypothetical protein QM530_01490 [Phycisphaerales bacterium]|nr:hypothetical protein [Phycisphaerales bacterium]